MSQSSFFCIFQLGDAGGNLREARGLLEEALLAAPDQVVFVLSIIPHLFGMTTI